MSYGNASTRYLEAEVLSRQPEWLVPLMYEHLLLNLRRASKQIELGDQEGKTVSLDKASAIVMELIGALDFERGGELARQLSGLYLFFSTEMIGARQQVDTARLQRLIQMISDLHEAWSQAAEAVAPRASTGVSMASRGA
jgi:flagellar protein FliS